MQNRTDLQIEEKIAFLFRPDVLLAPQYFARLGRSGNLDPARRLMIAVLQEGIFDFEKNVSPKARAPRCADLWERPFSAEWWE